MEYVALGLLWSTLIMSYLWWLEKDNATQARRYAARLLKELDNVRD